MEFNKGSLMQEGSCGKLYHANIESEEGQSKYACRIKCLSTPKCNAIHFSNNVKDGELDPPSLDRENTQTCILLQCPEDLEPKIIGAPFSSHKLLPEGDHSECCSCDLFFFLMYNQFVLIYRFQYFLPEFGAVFI